MQLSVSIQSDQKKIRAITTREKQNLLRIKSVTHFSLNQLPGCSSTPLEITGIKGNIKSRNYPFDYSNNLNCTWRITSPEGMRLKLTFDSFQLESSSTCKYDYVELRDGSSLLGKFCGKAVPSEKIAESGTMQVTFVSDGSVRDSGFLASYSAVPLGNEGKTVFYS